MSDATNTSGSTQSSVAAASLLPFVKGHGTGNDFIIIDSLTDDRDLTAPEVAALCDRRFGIGADGVLRVITRGGRYFMDYRNSDGSIAETCGNGLRVFCAYLHSRGLLSAGQHVVGTRGGEVSVLIDASGQVTVDMGAATVIAEATDVTINHDGGVRTLDAIAIAMPNPHCVALVDHLSAVGDLRVKPQVPAGVFPEEANVEFVQRISETHIAMRVWERGVGETQSCGSGACAAAFAAAGAAGLEAPWTMRVDVPGGTLTVACDENQHLHLSGPALLVAEGAVDMSQLDLTRA